KVGAQVMLTKNMQKDGLVNGSVGRILKFVNPREEAATFIQIAGLEDSKNDQTKARMHRWDSPTRPQCWPVVLFISGVERMITPHEFTSVNSAGNTEASREQVASGPLHSLAVTETAAHTGSSNFGMGFEHP
ncbi:hypothetical protein FIBSPDRAFT_722937, partial [Athelia psychrophila]